MKHAIRRFWERWSPLAILGVVLSLGAAACSTKAESAANDTLSARAVAANAREQGSLPRAATGKASAGRVTRGQARGASPTDAPLDGYGADVGFRSRARLTEHYEKHGREFGNISIEEYLQHAQALRDSRAGDDILEIVRDDGVVSRFDRRSGAFLAFDRDGTIRTYFKPNDGERYFRRQSRRRPNS